VGWQILYFLYLSQAYFLSSQETIEFRAIKILSAKYISHNCFLQDDTSGGSEY